MPPAKSRTSRLYRAFGGLTIFFLLGYVPTVLLGNPVPAMVLAVAAMMFLGARTGSVHAGLLWGLVLGAAAGVGVWYGLTGLAANVVPATDPATTGMVMVRKYPQEVLLRLAGIYVSASACMCGLAGALFAHAGSKRRRRG